MELNSITAPKSAAKAVTVALPTDGSGDAADAFAALMRAVGFQFSNDVGLSAVEGQFLRAREARPVDDAPRARPDADRPKAKNRPDDTSETSDDQAAPVKGKDHASDSTASSDEPSDAAAVTGAAATTAPTGEDSAVVAVQFEIVVQLPTGETNQIAVIDLETMLAAAAKDPVLAKALQDAFAGVLGGMQTLAGPLDGDAAKDLAAALAAAGIDMSAAGERTDPDSENLVNVFRQIIAALRPMADQSKPATAADAAARQAALAAEQGVDAGIDPSLDFQTAENARQAAELARSLGSDHKVKINVVIDGRLAANVPFSASPFNRFVGYTPADLRVESLANGQMGVGDQATASNAEGRAAVMSGAVSVATVAGQGSSATSSTLGAARSDAPFAAKPAEISAPSTSQGSGQAGSQSAFGAMTGQGTSSTAATQPGAPQSQPATPQQVIEQIKVHITRAAKAGLDRVTIQLRPEDLGRIEIKLEMFQDGKVKAMIAADNPATLELLQKDARGMERALNDAGLRADANDLEFSLRGEDSEKAAADRDGRQGRATADGRAGANDNVNPIDDERYDYQLAASRRGGVDTYA
ncbi:MAG: flagellar hook-length control protein FliK [Rhodospirillaceae bacterium]|nr:flagellar hook-length control protein FliK [Rhodospirillaceae bacterium]